MFKVLLVVLFVLILLGYVFLEPVSSSSAPIQQLMSTDANIQVPLADCAASGSTAACARVRSCSIVPRARGTTTRTSCPGSCRTSCRTPNPCKIKMIEKTEGVDKRNKYLS